MSDTASLGQAPRDETHPARRVAFGAFADWQRQIAAELEPRFAGSFVDLGAADLDAFDAIVPLQLSHYVALARRPDLRGIKFLHPSPDVAALCDDKRRLAQFLIAKGFGDCVPALRPPGAPYPYVWKQRRGFFGLQCQVIRGPEDETGLDLTDPAWFAQALAPGSVEKATHLLRAGGRIRYASTLTYHMGDPMAVKGALRMPLVTQMKRGCDHLDVFAAILDRLGYEGTACIDYKLVEGRPMIFEINPRYGASLTLDVNAYLDAYLGALGQGVSP